MLNTLPDPVVQMIRDHHRNGWTPMRRLGTPADIGNAVTLLCSNEAGWITGQLIAVDGGAGLMDPALPLAIQQPELRRGVELAPIPKASDRTAMPETIDVAVVMRDSGSGIDIGAPRSSRPFPNRRV